MKNKTFNIPVFVPHKGCRFTCSFCNQKSITGTQGEESETEIKEIIEKHLKTLPEGADIEIAFFGGSFTGIEKHRRERLLSIAYSYIQSGKANGIRISTRPDYINSEILENLMKYKVKTIELGVQSMDDKVLLLNNRGHTAKDAEKAAELINACGFTLGLQMMTGLYGSSKESDFFTGRELVRLRPDIVRIYPAVVLENTLLYEKFINGEYIPDSLDESIEKCKKLSLLFDENKIKVIRMGLQSTDNINEKNIAGGPYHSAFGELVQSGILRDEIEKLLINHNKKQAVLACKREYTSKITGNKKCNIKYFKENLGIDLKIKEDNSVDSYKIL